MRAQGKARGRTATGALWTHCATQARPGLRTGLGHALALAQWPRATVGSRWPPACQPCATTERGAHWTVSYGHGPLAAVCQHRAYALGTQLRCAGTGQHTVAQRARGQGGALCASAYGHARASLRCAGCALCGHGQVPLVPPCLSVAPCVRWAPVAVLALRAHALGSALLATPAWLRLRGGANAGRGHCESCAPASGVSAVQCGAHTDTPYGCRHVPAATLLRHITRSVACAL